VTPSFRKRSQPRVNPNSSPESRSRVIRERLFSCAKSDSVPEFATVNQQRRARTPRMRFSEQPSKFRLTRAALGGLLSLAFLAVSIPVDAMLPGQACSMPCCAGRATHAAGSCMGDACHAHFLRKKRAAPERLCAARVSSLSGRSIKTSLSSNATLGSTSVTETASPIQSPSETALRSSEVAARIALTKSCSADCVCLNNLARTLQSHEVTKLSSARPLVCARARLNSSQLPVLASVLQNQSRPRAPPVVA